ncbi:MAG TPA: membrane dipeptidase [Bacteroidota bacterium]|nr:membrane dipeptidase [Bacteroidota bacterium]
MGSDFDGISVTPAGLDDVTHFPELTKGLLERGYSVEDVDKILGGNFMRVLRVAEAR